MPPCLLILLLILVQTVDLFALHPGFRVISTQRTHQSIQRRRTAPKPHTFVSLQLFNNNNKESTESILTIEEIERFATFSKLKIKSSVTGPYLRLEAYPIDDDSTLVGYLTAFIRPFPFKLFQLDTIQVKNRRQNIGYKRKNWTVDGPGASFILGTWALAWARGQGCEKTELLAVRDSDEMHDILVRLYGRYAHILLFMLLFYNH